MENWIGSRVYKLTRKRTKNETAETSNFQNTKADTLGDEVTIEISIKQITYEGC